MCLKLEVSNEVFELPSSKSYPGQQFYEILISLDSVIGFYNLIFLHFINF